VLCDEFGDLEKGRKLESMGGIITSCFCVHVQGTKFYGGTGATSASVSKILSREIRGEGGYNTRTKGETRW
jgi:hypothetical protein